VEQRGVERKLAAVLAGDVAGYSRLMGADEQGTLAALKAHRRALVDPKIGEHRGEIIKTTGDGMLVEFASVVDAVRCAVEIQRGMGERNAGVSPDKRIEFRIGINLGDIIHDERDIFGDGVNVAARLEALAEPGGICISRSVRDPVQDKLRFTFEDIGEQTLKNISVPVHAYRVRFGGADPQERAVAPFRPRRPRHLFAGLAVGLGAVGAAAIVALYAWPWHPPRPIAPPPTVAITPLPLPDKPSIAVLKFTSIGGDARQERLVDGITEDVITDLSRYHALFVIARNSVFTYKGKAVNVQQVGRDLGVRYILEGSIQTSGDRVRVTAQLIEAATNAHVWSDRYDRPLGDIFDVQNEVTQKIAAVLGSVTGTLVAADATSIRRKPPANRNAYDYYIMGQEFYYQYTEHAVAKAKPLLEKAIELDPQFARAHFALGRLYTGQAIFGWGKENPATLFEMAKVELLEAVALDPGDALAHSLLGAIYFWVGDVDRGLAEYDKAFSLNPNDPDVLYYICINVSAVGRAKEAAAMADPMFRLNPNYPRFYNNVLDPYYATGQYDRVVTMVRRTVGEVAIWNYWVLAISYAQLGRQTDAAEAVTELRRRYPDFSMERMLSDFSPIPDKSIREHFMEGTRKASLRECATPEELQKYPKMMRLAVCDAKRATN
jgi:TolB-like protein/class 3 adenylate cyclase/Tfp pilus assembly protein PilF